MELNTIGGLLEKNAVRRWSSIASDKSTNQAAGITTF